MGGSRRWGDKLPTGVRKCSSPTDYCIFRRPMYEIAGEIDCQLCKSIQLLGSSPQTSLHGLYCWIPIILLHGQFLDPPLTDCAATTFENRLLHVYFSSCLSWWLLYFEFSPSLASMYACRLFLIDCYVTEALRHTITAGCIDGEVHDLISVQPCHNTRSLCTITLARPSPTLSSLKITNRSFRYAAPCLWNELPTNLREPRQAQSPALSPITHGISSTAYIFSYSLSISFWTQA